MIVPLVSEEEWLLRLATLPVWSSQTVVAEGPVLIVSPHPDDETLGAGGLIAHLRSTGIEVIVAAVTDGENAYGESSVLGQIRSKEQTAALACLGVDEANIYRFQIPDSDVASHESILAKLLEPLIEHSRHVVSPWIHDFHPDHESCGRVVERLAAKYEVQITFYVFWTWHRGSITLIDGLPFVRFPLSPRLVEAKQRALACHSSQLFRKSGDPILPERLLAPVYRNFETYLPSWMSDAS